MLSFWICWSVSLWWSRWLELRRRLIMRSVETVPTPTYATIYKIGKIFQHLLLATLPSSGFPVLVAHPLRQHLLDLGYKDHIEVRVSPPL